MLDRNAIELRGDRGVLEAGYRRAAELGAWTYSRGALTAVVVSYSPMYLGYPGLVAVLPYGKGQARRRVVSVRLSADGARLGAMLGGRLER